MRNALAAIVVVGLVVLFPGTSGSARDCTGPSTCSAAHLPAPITITAGRMSYRIGRDRHVSRARAAGSRYPPGSAWFPGTDSWFMIRHRHLLVGRSRATLWRSEGVIARARLGVIAAGPGAVAFQMDHRLYLARYGGSERPVARRELPLGWTAGGLYTYSYRRRQLLLRSDAGGIVKVIARRPREYEFDLASGSLYFVERGALLGAHGVRSWLLGSLRGFGLSPDTWMQPLGRLVELQDEQRMVVVRASGAEFASTRLPRLGRDDSSPDSPLVVDPRGSAIAFSAAFGQSHITEIVYLLRVGGHAAIPVHTERNLSLLCSRWADLGWHGRWLLYSDSQDRLAAIDTAGGRRTIELSGLVQRLLGTAGAFNARWGG